MSRMRRAAPGIIVWGVTFLIGVTASVAAAQAADAAKGNPAIMDLVVDRLAYLVIANVVAWAAVIITLWNWSRKRVVRVAEEVTNAKMSGVEKQLTRIEGLVRELSNDVADSRTERKRVSDTVARIEGRISDIEQRHHTEDAIASRDPHDSPFKHRRTDDDGDFTPERGKR